MGFAVEELQPHFLFIELKVSRSTKNKCLKKIAAKKVKYTPVKLKMREL